MIGMSVEANIVTQEKEGVLLLPAEALQDGAAFVVEAGRLQKRKPAQRPARHADD